MKIPKIPFSAKDLDMAIRAVPAIKDLFPKAKAGLNSLINEPEYNSKIGKLEDALHDKKAEICKLREQIEELEGVLIIVNDQYKDAQKKVELLQETIGGYQS